MIRRRSPRCLLLLLPGLLAACDRGLEVKGTLDRVVGEQVTLALVEGEPTFSGELKLNCADGARVEGPALQAVKRDARTIDFVVPAGIATGPATALAGRAGGGDYEVSLRLNRLALTLTDQGNLEAWPISPGSLPRATAVSAAPPGGLLALAPGGGELALAADGKVRLLGLGAEVKDVGTAVEQAGVVAVAAAAGHRVLVATDQSLILFQFAKGQPTTPDTIAFAELRAVAVSETGDLAIVAYACDGNHDGTLDASCVEQLTLSPTFAELDSTRVQLGVVQDGKLVAPGPDAKLLAATRDGKGAVVTDGAGIFGVYFLDAAPPHQSKIAWSSAEPPVVGQPVGLDRAPVKVGDPPQPVDLFAIAEKSNTFVELFAFNPDANFDLRSITTVALTDPPVALSYGRGTRLYVASEKTLVTLDGGVVTPQLAPVPEVTPVAPIVKLLVQP